MFYATLSGPAFALKSGTGSVPCSRMVTLTVLEDGSVPLPVTVNWKTYSFPGVEGVSNLATALSASVIAIFVTGPESCFHKKVSIGPLELDASNVICAWSPAVTD